MDEMEIKQKIRAFFAKFVGSMEIDEEEDLFTSGLVNSLFAMQLVLYTEKEFCFKVENEDLDLKNFNSINAITGFIQRKKI